MRLQVEIATASWIESAAVSSREHARAARPSGSASFSRSASGAVLCEAPIASRPLAITSSSSNCSLSSATSRSMRAIFAPMIAT